MQSSRNLNETVGNMNVPPSAANKVENYQPRTWIETLTGAGAAAVGPLGARIRDRRHHPVSGRARCATRDGDFIGEIRVGQEVGAFDVAQAALQRFNWAQRAKVAQHKT